MVQKQKSDKWLILQSFVFLVLSLSFIMPSGDTHCPSGVCTLSIGNWHLHDALWHISLSKLGFVSWPLANPFISGQVLHGYNFLIDYILYLLIKIGISPFFSFFKILPIVAGILYVWTVTKFVQSRTSSPLKANLLAFFLYFGSSFSYLATIYASSTFYYASLRGFPVVSSIQPATMFLNLQFAFSLSIILWILMILARPMFKRRAQILGALFFILFGLKFYAGIIALGLVGGITFLRGVRKGLKAIRLPEIFTISLGSIVGLVIFYGISGSTQIPFTWAPFAITHLLIDDPLLFYNHSLTLARYYLYANNTGFSPRLIGIELYSIGLFLLINFGTRIISCIYVIKESIHRTLSDEYLVITGIILLTVLVPILFVQDGGWYNTMQFLYYGVWLSGIVMTEMLFEIVSTSWKYRYIFFVAIILFTIPNDIEQIRYLTAEQVSIGSDELKALSILKAAPPGVVHIFNSEHKNALVPALAEKFTYYLDTDQLMVTHAEYQDRLAFMTKYSGGSITTVPANYYLIYKNEWGTEDAIRALTSPTQYELIYDSNEIALYHKI